jgi:hypothetical protein
MNDPSNSLLSGEGQNINPVVFKQAILNGRPWAWIARVTTESAMILALHGQAALGQLYDHGDPTNEEQYLMELVNRARLDPEGEAARYGIDLNEGLSGVVISATPKQPLAFNPELTAGARGHSLWMLDNDVFSHTGGNGSDPGERMRSAGYKFSGSWTYGENIAWQGTTGTLDLTRATQSIHENLFVDEGIDGRGHRINLMNPSFRQVGIGTLSGVFTASGRDYNAGMVTQDFAASGAYPKAFLVGVVYEDRDGDGFYSPGEGLGGVTVQPADGSFYAVTSSSGGFAIPIVGLTGELTVAISSGPLAGTIAKRVALTGQNVKLDFDTAKDMPSTNDLKLGLPRLSANGDVTLRISGNAGQTVDLQASEDLRDWRTVQTATLTSPEMDIADPSASGEPKRFYRAIAR